MIIRFIFSLFLSTMACAGCGLIYKQNIQQGNALEQDDLDELYIGMNQRQVLFVLGTPSVKDPFLTDRWDYVQTFSRRGSDMVQRTITLRFEDDLLAKIEGRDDTFGASAGAVTGDVTEVATFVKSPGKSSGAGSTTPSTSGQGTDSQQTPQEAAMESAEDEVMEGVDPDIEAINERTSEDRDYQRDMDVLDQTPDDDLTGPDIDG
jgi:outer membrane protein assembly factor BamE